jgi:hypothetical protein
MKTGKGNGAEAWMKYIDQTSDGRDDDDDDHHHHHHHLYFQDVEKSIQLQNKQYRVQSQYSYRGK